MYKTALSSVKTVHPTDKHEALKLFCIFLMFAKLASRLRPEKVVNLPISSNTYIDLANLQYFIYFL